MNNDRVRLISPEHVLKISQDASEVFYPGVYFLIDDEEIVYVGSSVNVYARIASHWMEKKKTFDSYTALYIEDNFDRALALEACYIVRLQPRYNTTIPGNAYLISQYQIKKLYGLGGVQVNKILRQSKVEAFGTFGGVSYYERPVLDAAFGGVA